MSMSVTDLSSSSLSPYLTETSTDLHDDMQRCHASERVAIDKRISTARQESIQGSTEGPLSRSQLICSQTSILEEGRFISDQLICDESFQVILDEGINFKMANVPVVMRSLWEKYINVDESFKHKKEALDKLLYVIERAPLSNGTLTNILVFINAIYNRLTGEASEKETDADPVSLIEIDCSHKRILIQILTGLTKQLFLGQSSMIVGEVPKVFKENLFNLFRGLKSFYKMDRELYFYCKLGRMASNHLVSDRSGIDTLTETISTVTGLVEVGVALVSGGGVDEGAAKIKSGLTYLGNLLNHIDIKKEWFEAYIVIESLSKITLEDKTEFLNLQDQLQELATKPMREELYIGIIKSLEFLVLNSKNDFIIEQSMGLILHYINAPFDSVKAQIVNIFSKLTYNRNQKKGSTAHAILFFLLKIPDFNSIIRNKAELNEISRTFFASDEFDKKYIIKGPIKFLLSSIGEVREAGNWQIDSIFSIIAASRVKSLYPNFMEYISVLYKGSYDNGVYGLNPYHAAVVYNNPDIIRLIPDYFKNADLNKRSSKGKTPLDLADENGYRDCSDALKLVKRKPDIVCSVYDDDVSTVDGNMVRDIAELRDAILESNYKRLNELILVDGFDANKKDDFGLTALHYTALMQDKKTLTLIMGIGVEAIPEDFSRLLNEVSKEFVKDLLFKSVEKGSVSVLRCLKKYLCDQGRLDEFFEAYDSFQNSLLMVAALKNQSDVFAWLLEMKIDIMHINTQDHSILHILAAKESPAALVMYEALIGSGLPISLYTDQDLNGSTPIHLAAGTGGALLLSKILECKAGRKALTITDNMGRKPIHIAVIYASYAGPEDDLTADHVRLYVFRVILEKYRKRYNGRYQEEELVLNINSKDSRSYTPLLYAAQGACLKVFKYLIDFGADLSAVCDDGETCLHKAAFVRSYDIVLEFMLASLKSSYINGCELIKQKDFNGETALMELTKRGNPDSIAAAEMKKIFKLLIGDKTHIRGLGPKDALILRQFENKGISLSDRNIEGRNFMHLASHHGVDSILGIRLKVSWIGSRDVNGYTPLILAVRGAHRQAVEIILGKNKSLVFAVDAHGRDAAMHAVAQGHYPIADYLYVHGSRLYRTDKDGYNAAMIVFNKKVITPEDINFIASILRIGSLQTEDFKAELFELCSIWAVEVEGESLEQLINNISESDNIRKFIRDVVKSIRYIYKGDNKLIYQALVAKAYINIQYNTNKRYKKLILSANKGEDTALTILAAKSMNTKLLKLLLENRFLTEKEFSSWIKHQNQSGESVRSIARQRRNKQNSLSFIQVLDKM